MVKIRLDVETLASPSLFIRENMRGKYVDGIRLS